MQWITVCPVSASVVARNVGSSLARRLSASSSFSRSALERGDRVLPLAGQVEVRRGEFPVACWVAEVGVWDVRAGLDGEFWGELALAAARRKDPAWRRRAAEAARIGRGLALDRPAASGRFGLADPAPGA